MEKPTDTITGAAKTQDCTIMTQKLETLQHNSKAEDQRGDPFQKQITKDYHDIENAGLSPRRPDAVANTGALERSREPRAGTGTGALTGDDHRKALQGGEEMKGGEKGQKIKAKGTVDRKAKAKGRVDNIDNFHRE